MSMQPFLIVDVKYEEIGDSRLITILHVKDLDGESHQVKVEGCIPRFWTEKDPSSIPNLPSFVVGSSASKMTTIDGKPLYEVRVQQPSQIYEIRDFFYPHYSADVSWRSLVRWIYGWEAVVEINKDNLNRTLRPREIKSSDVDSSRFELNVLWFDIETADSLDTKDAPERVVSIAIMDSVTGIHEIGTTSPTSQRQVQRFLSSQEALESVVEHTKSIPPVEMNKVKVQNFDHSDPDTNEAALLWWFKQRVEELNRDLLGGQNIISYDIPYLVNRCKRMRRLMAQQYPSGVPTEYKFPNLSSTLYRPLFDSKIAYAEQTQGAAATTGSGSLAWMASTTLGYGKVPRTRITDLMVRDPMMLAVYNAWDNVCVERCISQLKLIPFYLTKVAFHNSFIKYAHSNMMLIEDSMGHLLMKQKIIMPSIEVVKSKLSGSIEQGGFVMENPVGVFEDAFEADNSMEYPSAIITTNGSPDTLVNPADYPEGYPFPVCITPAGRVYRRDKEGIMPSVLRNLASLRKQTQQEMREAYDAGDDELGDTLNRKQRVQKESMNSWYGVLGSGQTEKTRRRPFRLALPELGSDITEIARLHNAWNKEYIEKTSLWFGDMGIEPVVGQTEGIELRFHVIGQDTDSCKVAITNHAEAVDTVRPFTKTDIIGIGNILCKMMNDSYDLFVQTHLQVPKNEFFFVKPDAYYRRFFSWGVKKRYAYRDYDGKYAFRGVEIRRSSAPQVVKDAQQEVFGAILEGCDRQELNQVLRDIHDRLMDETQTESIDFGQPFGVKKTGTQAHKAAMWSNQHLGTEFDIGDKPVLFVASNTRKNVLPANRIVAIEWGETPESFGVQIDRKAAFKKHFLDSNSWDAILSAFNTSWTSALTNTNQTDLESWFA